MPSVIKTGDSQTDDSNLRIRTDQSLQNVFNSMRLHKYFVL